MFIRLWNFPERYRETTSNPYYSFASEAPDQAPRELRDGTGPRPAGPPGTDGRTKIVLKHLIFPYISLVFQTKNSEKNF